LIFFFCVFPVGKIAYFYQQHKTWVYVDGFPGEFSKFVNTFWSDSQLVMKWSKFFYIRNKHTINMQYI